MTELPVELHFKVKTSDQTALALLTERSGLRPDQIQRCFDHGAVWLQISGKPRRLYKSDFSPVAGNSLHLYCQTTTLKPCPYQASLLSDFNAFSVWHKPAGMLSQGSKWGDHWTIQQWIKQQVWPQRECHITHRLDRFTSGLMLIAHDPDTNRRLHRMFEQREIEKTYRARVLGCLEAGQEFDLNEPIDGRYALTTIRVLESDPDLDRSLVEIHPATGRKHQIRVHLSNAGYPVVGDRLYGQPPFDDDLALQACALSLTNPLSGEALLLTLEDDKLLTLTNSESKP